MTSFPPGTKVLARTDIRKPHRPATVVDGPLDESGIVRVKFIGKSKIFELPSKHVKLPPKNSASVDQPAAPQRQQESPSEAPTTTVPTFSDPFRDPTHDVQPSPQIQPPSNPQNEIPRTYPSTPANTQASNIDSAKKSSRDWLLANPPTRTHPTTRTEPTNPYLRSEKRQPHVVSDPTSNARVQHGREPEPYFRDDMRERGAIENTPSSSQHVAHENWNGFGRRSYSQSFKFTPIRADPLSHPNTPHLSTSRDPFSRNPVPLISSVPRHLPGRSPPGTTPPWSSGFSAYAETNHNVSPVRPHRSMNPPPYAPRHNGLRTSHHDRHPFRSVDEDLRIPRTLGSQRDPSPLPRHPHTAFDDDVPIPRNIRSSEPGSGSATESIGDQDYSMRPYSSRKRQKVHSGLVFRGESLRSHVLEVPQRTMSLRLWKREERREPHNFRHREDLRLRPLPYQQLIEQRRDAIIIAPCFDISVPFIQPLEDTDILDRIADVSINEGGILSDNLEEDSRRLGGQADRILVQSGGRRKSRPKKCCADSHENGPDPGENVCAEQNALATGNSVPKQSDIYARIRAWDGMEHRQVEQEPAPRVYECSCEHDSKHYRRSSDDWNAIQCSVCTLWSHMPCAQLELAQSADLRRGAADGKTKYVCIQCLDRHVSFAASHSRPAEQICGDGAKWLSSVRAISEVVPDIGTDLTEKHVGRGRLCDKCERQQTETRRHLSEHEIEERAENLQRLREGVANISIGGRERALFDDLLMKMEGDRRI